ncbi:MAG: protein kinase [Lentisphaeria bacterium]|nr:protein kinase [Lentisphaeria bacterium]
MRFQCSNCMGVVAIDDSEAGHAVGCGHCGSIILVPQSRVAAGAIIDDFVIEKEIGQGGLATVYLAHQMSLDRPAALKILRDQYASNRSFIADFVKEARAAAQLNHPNIVQAYAVGEEDGIHYFAMEFVHGETLKHVLAHSGRLFPDRALAIIRVIAEALDFAWNRKQLVHLDIKPDNIILTEGKEYKLADLGLARIGGDIRGQSDTSDVFGTPQYIAPEILTGSATDNRTDIYSLGATLYHAVTGKHPFEGKSASEIARKHITDPLIPACEVSKDIPRDVSDLIDIMMAKRPGHRWQSAGEVVEQIDNIKAGQPISRRPDARLQAPLTLEKIEEEFSATLADLDEEPAGDGKVKFNVKKGGGTTFRAKAGGSVNLRKGKAEKAAKPTLGSAGGTRGKSRLTIKTGDKAAALTTQSATAGSSGPAASQKGDDRPTVPKKSKKKMSPGAMLGCLGGVFVVLAVMAAVGIFALKKAAERAAFEKQVAAMGLSVSQYEQLRAFRAQLEIGVDDTTVLAEAAKLLEQHADSPAMTDLVREDVAPVLEREARTLRAERRDVEIAAWRDRARELQEAARLAELEAAKQRLEEEEARKQREREERLRLQREALVASLRQEMPTIRQQMIEQCGKLNFEGAKISLTRFVNAPDDELVAWGKNWQQAIDLAVEAMDLIRNGEKYLLGEYFSAPGRAQRVAVTDIRVRSIAAEYRERIYRLGQPTDDYKVEKVTVDFTEIRVDQLIKLMETSGRKQAMEVMDLNVRIGAYLRVTGASPALVEKYLRDAGMSDIVEAMLREL